MEPSDPFLRSLRAVRPWFELFRVVSLNPTSAMFETLFSQKKQIFRARLSFQMCPGMSREQSSVNCSSFKMHSMALLYSNNIH